MDHLVITYNTILSFFGAVAVIGGGLKLLINLFNPFHELKERLDKHDQLFDNDNKRLRDIDEALERIEESQKLQGRAIMEQLNHVISGNDIDKLKKRYTDLVDYYIDK